MVFNVDSALQVAIGRWHKAGVSGLLVILFFLNINNGCVHFAKFIELYTLTIYAFCVCISYFNKVCALKKKWS